MGGSSYLIPHLSGNANIKDPSRFAPGRDFIVLGVESSCDDTAATVVRSDGSVLGECRVLQDQLTEEWGGVVPHVARDAHAEVIRHVINSSLREASISPDDLDAVDVTMGPGLEMRMRRLSCGESSSERTR